MTVSVVPRLEAIAEMKITINHPIRSASAPGHLLANGDCGHLKTEIRKIRERRWRGKKPNHFLSEKRNVRMTSDVKI